MEPSVQVLRDFLYRLVRFTLQCVILRASRRRRSNLSRLLRLTSFGVAMTRYGLFNKPPYPAGELADRDGSCLPLPIDKAARVAAGDPRPSIAERYASGTDYVAQVQAVVSALLRDRLLLQEDADRYLERARGEPRVAR